MNKPSDKEQPTLERALISFQQYPSFERIPKALFRTVRGIIESRRIRIDHAVQQIAHTIWEDQKQRNILSENSIDELRSKVERVLMESRPSNPGMENVIRLVQPAE